MIRQADLSETKSPEQVWAAAEDVRQHPEAWWAKEFCRFTMVSRATQFSSRPIPANKWFIDWGLPRKAYGGFALVDVHGFGRTCQAKLSTALCPKCRNPIFSLLFKNPTGDGYPKHTRRQCVICGYFEDLTVRRDGEAEGLIVYNGLRLEKRLGSRDWVPAPTKGAA